MRRGGPPFLTSDRQRADDVESVPDARSGRFRACGYEEEVAVRTRHGLTVERAGTTYLITCHPAAAARFPAIRQAVLQDFRQLKRLARQRLSQARHNSPVVSRGMAGGPSRLGREDGKRQQNGVHGSPAD